MEALRCNNLTRKFKDGEKDIVVLDKVNMSIEKQDFVSIVGKSGAGKSTLMYQLGLLDIPTAGEVYIDGIKTSAMTVKEKTHYRLNNFGFVFQYHSLLPDLNAWENVAMTGIMRGEGKKKARADAMEVLEVLGLGERMEGYPSQLSGGENQRVSLARAIVHKPAILFADEPTASLDEERSRKIIELFVRLNNEGQTIVMVTHEPDYANMSKRIIDLTTGGAYDDTRLREI